MGDGSCSIGGPFSAKVSRSHSIETRPRSPIPLVTMCEVPTSQCMATARAAARKAVGAARAVKTQEDVARIPREQRGELRRRDTVGFGGTEPGTTRLSVLGVNEYSLVACADGGS